MILTPIRVLSGALPVTYSAGSIGGLAACAAVLITVSILRFKKQLDRGRRDSRGSSFPRPGSVSCCAPSTYPDTAAHAKLRPRERW